MRRWAHEDDGFVFDSAAKWIVVKRPVKNLKYWAPRRVYAALDKMRTSKKAAFIKLAIVPFWPHLLRNFKHDPQTVAHREAFSNSDPALLTQDFDTLTQWRHESASPDQKTYQIIAE